MKTNLWFYFSLLAVCELSQNALAASLPVKDITIAQEQPGDDNTLAKGELKKEKPLRTTKDVIDKIEAPDEHIKSDVNIWFLHVQKGNPNTPEVLEVLQALLLQNMSDVIEMILGKSNTQRVTIATTQNLMEIIVEILDTEQLARLDEAMEKSIKKIIHQVVLSSSTKEKANLANFIADKVSKENTSFIEFMTEPALFEATSERQKEDMIKRAIFDQNEKSLIKVINSVDPALMFHIIAENHALVEAAKQNGHDTVESLLKLSQHPEVKKLDPELLAKFYSSLSKAKFEAEQKGFNGVIFLIKKFELDRCEEQHAPSNSSESRKEFFNWVLVNFISRNILPPSAHQWLWMKEAECAP